MPKPIRFTISRASQRGRFDPSVSPHPQAVWAGPQDGWIIEIAQLTTLLALDPQGVIVKPAPAGGLPHLTIYDDYTE